MKKIFILFILIVNSSLILAQVTLVKEGMVVNNTITGNWEGIVIPRAVPTIFSFLNNSVTSVNTTGYILQAGDEVPGTSNNNLDGAVITGNRLVWKGTDMKSITHGIFTGHNKNLDIKYNSLDHVPMGIIRKSGNNMTNTSGGVAYNIVKGGAVCVVVKGMSNVNIFNNTFYQDRTTSETWRGLIDIYVNVDNGQHSVSTGVKIKNNIFYARYETPMIYIEDPYAQECLSGFESDYNVFYCETGSVKFKIGTNLYSFAQWQGMGYDLHSVVVNPNFINTVDFVPKERLDYGTDLGATWQTGLSVAASWIAGTSPATTIQNGKWQAGAIIYPAPPPPVVQVPVYSGSSIENATPRLLEMAYNLTLASIVPAVAAFSVTVNSVTRNVTSVAVSGTKVLLTLDSPVVYGDVINVAYTKPAADPLQTASGGQAASLTAQSVVNRVAAVIQAPVANSPPVVVINSPAENHSGFIGELNATGSYDPNHDNLTFTWIVPGNVPVSSTSSSKIQFLSPIVETNQTIEFTLRVSDGKSVQTKTVPVVILPYKPELESAEVANIDASGFQSPYYPYNIIDGNIGTMWSVTGDEQWILLELKESFAVQHLKLSFQPGQKSESYFDILGSEDGLSWELVLSKASSCGFSGNLQVFDFPPSKATREYNFIKLVGHANSSDSWNHISEFKIFGYKHRNPTSYEIQSVKLYPNPANDIVNIKIDDSKLEPEFIKIINLSGEIMLEEKVPPGTLNLQIPLELSHGIYIVQIGSGNMTLFTQKLIVGRSQTPVPR